MSVKEATQGVTGVRIDRDGRAWVDGVEVLNRGVTITFKPNDIAMVTLETALVDFGEIDGVVSLAYAAAIGPDLDLIEANGSTVPETLRRLADLVEQRAAG